MSWTKTFTFTESGTQTMTVPAGFDAKEWDFTVTGSGSAVLAFRKRGHTSYINQATVASDNMIVTGAGVDSVQVTSTGACIATLSKVE